MPLATVIPMPLRSPARNAYIVPGSSRLTRRNANRHLISKVRWRNQKIGEPNLTNTVEFLRHLPPSAIHNYGNEATDMLPSYLDNNQTNTFYKLRLRPLSELNAQYPTQQAPKLRTAEFKILNASRRRGIPNSEILARLHNRRRTINARAKTLTKLRNKNSQSVTNLYNASSVVNAANIGENASHFFAELHNSIPNNLKEESNIKDYLISKIHRLPLGDTEKGMLLAKVKEYYP